MNRAKKLLSLFLAVVMIFSCLSAAAYAVRKDEYYPSIVIPGLFQSETHYYENGEIALNSEGKPYEAPFFLDTTSEIVKDALENALCPIARLLITQRDKDLRAANAVADVLGRTLMEKNRCDENGKFVHDVRAVKYDVSFAELSEHDRDHIIDQLPLLDYIDIAGEENLYVFSYESLGNMMDIANELFRFIGSVKERTGADKVNIVPISQGGSITNALMQIYNDKGISMARDINRMVLVVPALDGSILIGEIYEKGLLDDSFNLYNTMFPSLIGEDKSEGYLVNIILRILPNADVNNIIDTAVDRLILDYLRYSTMLWGLCPSGNYPPSREKYLNDEKAAEIVKQTDWFYNAQLNSDANILKAIDEGVEVFDIVDYNHPLYQLVDSWDKVNGDGIIQLDSTSMGAYSLGVDKKLPEGYVPCRENCTDPTHNHIDPYGIVDAGAGLLPDHTFYFHNQNHEKTGHNDVIMKLAAALLTDENFTDVYSYPDRFPQFNESRNAKRFIREMNAMKNFNYEGVPEELKKELFDAIDEGQAVISNTAVDTEAYETAKENFYAARDKVYESQLPEYSIEKLNKHIIKPDFSHLFRNFMKRISDFLYRFFKGAGYSELYKAIN